MFKAASRQKLRFTHKGICSIEELWDMSLSELDKIYKELSGKLQSKQGDSLLQKASKEDDIINLQLSIVKDVFETLNTEKDAAKDRKLKKEKKSHLLEIIAHKQDADLQNKSVEELTALVNDL